MENRSWSHAKVNPQAYDHAGGFRDARGHFLEGNDAAGDVVQLGCDLADTYKRVRKLCPFYLACENRNRGKHWECNGSLTTPEYYSMMAARGLLREPYVPPGPHAAKPGTDGHEAGAGPAPRPTSLQERHDRAARFVSDLPAYVGYCQGERAFRAAGMGGRTTFSRLWKPRKGGT